MSQVNIIKSESWCENKCSQEDKLLQECIDEFIGPNDRIINIETKQRSGLNRFWIYVETE